MRNENNEPESIAVSGENVTPTRFESTTETEERWLPIPGFEGKYEVSDQGRVRNVRRPDRVFSPLDNGTGYKQVSLVTENGSIVKRYIHWAVLSAFVGPRPKSYCACHNDGNRANNKLSNLRWDTVSGNLKDRRLHGTALFGERHMWTTKFNEKFARQAKQMLKTGFPESQIALTLGVSQAHINAISQGKTWAHIEVEDFYTKPVIEEFDG